MAKHNTARVEATETEQTPAIEQTVSTPAVKSDQEVADSLSPTMNTTAKIRFLATQFLNTDGSVNRGRIAKVLKTKAGNAMKYQQVRNTLLQPVKKS